MKEYDKPHLPTVRQGGHRVNLIPCALQTMNYVILQGLKENLRELDIFIKTNLFQSLQIPVLTYKSHIQRLTEMLH